MKPGNETENDRQKKRKVTSLTLGTGGKRLWLLRSRPDQVDRPSMRGGPSRRILTSVARQCDCCGAKKRAGPLQASLCAPGKIPSCNGSHRLQIACRNTRNRTRRPREK